MTTTYGRRGHPLTTMVLLACAAALAMGGLAGCGSSKAKTQGHATPTQATSAAKKGWNVVASPAVGSEGNLEAVAALSATSAWAVGQDEGTDGIEHTLIERWDGSQWSVVDSPSPGQDGNQLSAVSVDSATDAWAVGTQRDASTTQQPLIEHWNGSVWSAVSVPQASKVGSQLNGVAAISPNDVWAVGSLQGTTGSNTPSTNAPLIEHWNGSAWSVINGPTPPQPTDNSGNYVMLYGVTALATNNVWAVGVNGSQSLVEHWNGSKWSLSLTPTQPPSVNGSALVAVSAVAPTDIWAVGSGALSAIMGCAGGYGPLIEHWNGAQWATVTPASPSDPQGHPYFSLSGVAAISPSSVWAVGSQATYDQQNGQQIVPVVEHWDGSQWSLASVAPVNTAYGLTSVAASQGLALAVGQHHDANDAGPTLVEQLAGGSWSPVTSPSPGTVRNALNGVAGVSTSDVWAVGQSGDGALTEHWNGGAWSVVATPNGGPYDDSLSAVATISPSDAWAVGTAPNTDGIIEHWNGAQWALSQGVSGVSGLTGVAAVSSSSVYVTGAGSGGPTVEHWNGSGWSALPALAPLAQNTMQYENLLGITALSDNNVWVVGGTVGHSCGGALPAVIEHWDGAHWTVVPNVPDGTLSAISASGPNDIWAVGALYPSGAEYGVMHYDGKTWTPISFPGPANQQPQLKSVSAHAPNDVWVVGTGYTGQRETPVALHWDGKTWTKTPVPLPRDGANALYGVAAVGASDVWAVGYFNGCIACMDQQALIERYQG